MSETASSMPLIHNPLTHDRYAEGHLTTVDVANTRKAIASLLEKYRAGGKPENIVHIVHEVPEGAPVFTPGTDLAKEFSELTPKEGEKVFKKNFPSSFAKTGLKEYLDSIGIEKIVVHGEWISECGDVGNRLTLDVIGTCLRLDDCKSR
jgi:nicotinamidase-related amidase